MNIHMNMMNQYIIYFYKSSRCLQTIPLLTNHTKGGESHCYNCSIREREKSKAQRESIHYHLYIHIYITYTHYIPVL